MSYYESTQSDIYGQACWAPKLRHKSLYASQTRKPIEIIVPSTQSLFALQPQQYTYPKPKLEQKECKIEIDATVIPEVVSKNDGNCCEGCRLTLGGQVLTTVTNKYWHSKCFKCQECKVYLEHIEYYEQNDKPYCALDFHELFSPRCDYCKTPIEADRKIVALGKSYHVGHAFCRECGVPFEEEDRIIEKDGYGYCENDYNKLFAKMCKGCGEYISEGFIKALGGEWHRACFVCVDCRRQFTSLTFKLKGGKPYCGEECPVISQPRKSITSFNSKSEENSKKTCRNCQKPIMGKWNTAFGYYYHPIHFQCSQCDKVLSSRLTGEFCRQPL